MTPADTDNTLALLHRALDRLSVRTAVRASNLANVDTPGYRALDVRFAAELGRATRGLELERTAERHLGGAASGAGRFRIVEAPASRMRDDGNTVDVDREMVGLAADRGRYGIAARLVTKRFALMRYAITDGRG